MPRSLGTWGRKVIKINYEITFYPNFITELFTVLYFFSSGLKMMNPLELLLRTIAD